MTDPRVQSAFKVPPEVPRYFAERGLKPGFSWLDTWGAEHAHAFTVAKAVDVELLTLFRDSIATAIDKGQGFETWRKELGPELARLGWAGKRLVADPDGTMPDKAVDFSSPRRLKTIFSSNMRSARAAGQWDRIQRTKAALPYLLYIRTTSAEPRPEHLRWAGTILPADDVFWRTHFPPNGWNCKCAVRQVSKFERGNLLDRKDDPDVGYSDERPPLVERTFVNKRTGEIARVPVGIDPGWGHNPGLAAERRRTGADALTAQIERAATPPPIAPPAAPSAPAAPPSPAPAPPVPPVPRDRLKAETRGFVQSEDFVRQHRAARAKAIARRNAGRRARVEGADEAAAREAAAPLDAMKLPVAVMPERLDAFRGTGPVVVSADEAAIGASTVPAADWIAVQDVLDRGEIQAQAGEPDRLWGILGRGERSWSLGLARIRGSWRVLGLTLQKLRGRLPEGRSVVLPEADPDP